jgi:hypothetical protein
LSEGAACESRALYDREDRPLAGSTVAVLPPVLQLRSRGGPRPDGGHQPGAGGAARRTAAGAGLAAGHPSPRTFRPSAQRVTLR